MLRKRAVKLAALFVASLMLCGAWTIVWSVPYHYEPGGVAPPPLILSESCRSFEAWVADVVSTEGGPPGQVLR
jgi:hypothetical protein